MIGRSGVTYIFRQNAASGGPKCLDGEDFPFFHLGLVLIPDERYRLSTVNAIMLDIVRTYTPNCLDRVGFPPDIDLVAFHGFLDCSTDIADADVNPSGLMDG